jgi:sulfite exporter TauE/SafE
VRRISIGFLAFVSFLTFASIAWADSGTDGYDVVGGVLGDVNTGGSATTQVAQQGSLPFTGLNLALVVIAGALLLALGLGMRRLGKNKA